MSFVVFRGAIPLFQVEPEGVEPSSKQAAEMLSTSLVLVCLSAAVWHGTSLAAAYLLKFRLRIEACARYLSFYDASDRTLDGRTSGETPAAADLVRAAGFAAVTLRMHKKFRRLLAWELTVDGIGSQVPTCLHSPVLAVKTKRPRGKERGYKTSPLSCNMTLSVLAFDRTVILLLMSPLFLAV